MKILVIGGGAREHALAWKLSRETAVSNVVCSPGNPGIESVANVLPVDVASPEAILRLAQTEAIDLTVIGPEMPLSQGVVDHLQAAGRLVLGPTKAAAALESSKAFAKDFMARHGVPTARFVVCDTAEAALSVIRRGELGLPLVVKADGLAAGKGVVIAEDRMAAEQAVEAAMVGGRFGEAGRRVVLEEFLVGEEASYFVLADGERCLRLASAQDHKRIFDDDLGPNTGGMGAFAPSPLVTPSIEREVLDQIVEPVLRGMRQEGRPFRGFLYVGLMLTASGPRVVEFNVRFGDPEAQVVLPMVGEDLAPLLAAAAAGRLESRAAHLLPRPHVGVVLAAGGYPDAVQPGALVHGLEEAGRVPGALVFHAGTQRADDHVVTAGGRVLTVVGSGASHREAIDVAYRAAACIRFEGMQMRRDIGKKALVALGAP